MAIFIPPINAIASILANPKKVRQELFTKGAESFLKNPAKHLIDTLSNGGVSSSALEVANKHLDKSNGKSINWGNLLTSMKGLPSFFNQFQTYIEPVPLATNITTKSLQGR